MMYSRRSRVEADRFADRRRREDEAPKLAAQVPTLKSLRLEIEERMGAGGTKHVRRVVIERAPALFLVPCGDPRCIDGEHDLTSTVMRGLRDGQCSFHGTDECAGSVGTSPCLRVLHFDGTAEYTA
jgi:hypothetical protein